MARLAALAATGAARRLAVRAMGVFWNTDVVDGAVHRRSAGSEACFAEWFLHDYVAPSRAGPLLGEFADSAVALSAREEQLLFALLLTPTRAFEVTETPGPGGAVVRDLLTGSEGVLGPVGLPDGLIRSDIGVGRVLPLGRLRRTGVGLLGLPAAARGELLAYLRTAYGMSRPGRHVSLEDYVDGSAHLYHHFFLERGKELGGRAHRTCRWMPFVTGRVEYRGLEMARIRAALARQSVLEQVGEVEEGVRYLWLDRLYGLALGTVLLQRERIEASAETEDDLAGLAEFLETCLRGLIQRVATDLVPPPTQGPGAIGRPAPGSPGTTFIRRMLTNWPDTPSPALADQAPRAACLSQAGRQAVTQLLLGLDRSMGRQKRMGKAWADVGPVWDELQLTEPSPHDARGEPDTPSLRGRERPRTARR
jgi:hypothetical protein